MSRPVLATSEEGARPARLDRDRSLVEAARRDPSRFDALYRKYLAQVYSYSYYELRNHHAAEDATERVFMQALAGLPRFEERVDAFIASRRVTAVSGSASDMADISTFRVWLFRIARNVVANERRTDRRRPASPLEDAIGLHAPGDVAETAAAREAGSAAWQAVARLPEDRRRAVILRFVDEMSTVEIAAVLGRSEGAVRVLLHRALRSVAQDLRRQLS
ncbi:MAG TPA: RNA polymerase sigma factor [Terriglobales bacterium]|nr:RNA polymerase sigma factor [Terriglobales bacterium]